MRKANATLMKEMNLNHVREVMKQLETAAKPQLASMTGLSVVTVNSLVKELHERGELFEDLVVPSNGGRPAQTYRYNYDFSLALVLYLQEKQGQELVSAAVVNLEDRILAKEEYIMPVLDRQYFRTIIAHFLPLYPSIKMIGLGIPGQAVHGEITVSSHQELKGSRMIEDIETEFGLKVLVENDVNAAISGYCMEHGEAEEHCVLGIYFPGRYPPGMGIILDGKVIRGKHGMSGEIKFLPDSPDWSREMSTNVFVDVVCRILHTVNAVLAPDKIVIYQDRVEEDRLAPAWKLYMENHPMPTFPEVILQNTFQLDFETGLRGMTLKGLQSNLAPLR